MFLEAAVFVPNAQFKLEGGGVEVCSLDLSFGIATAATVLNHLRTTATVGAQPFGDSMAAPGSFPKAC